MAVIHCLEVAVGADNSISTAQ